MTNFTNANLLHDQRVDCWSLMTTMTVGGYISLVETAYEKRGGLKYQREALKTTSGRRIRARMVDDIIRGAILPPVVIGVVVDETQLGKIENQSADDTMTNIRNVWSQHVSIIDGMQRTTAILDAIDKDDKVSSGFVRVEAWISKNTDSLIYRMLVLNTGQVPWNLKRQLQVIYAPLIDEMQKHVRFERLLTLEKPGRRTKGGEFSADSLVEAYLAFGLRRTEIDTPESLADEFSRLDMAEAISSQKYNLFFYPIVQTLVDLDQAFSRLDLTSEPSNEDIILPTKFSIGRNIFDSQPARVGFIVAAAVSVLGRLGMDKDVNASQEVLEKIREGVGLLVSKLALFLDDELRLFLSLDVLGERLMGQKKSAIGRYERTFFETAFKVLIEEGFDVPSMEVCWRA